MMLLLLEEDEEITLADFSLSLVVLAEAEASVEALLEAEVLVASVEAEALAAEAHLEVGNPQKKRILYKYNILIAPKI